MPGTPSKRSTCEVALARSSLGAMAITTASLLHLFDGALRSDFDLHLLAYTEQEPTWILHSPLHIRHREPRSCGHGVCVYLHLKRQFQRMIGSVNIEGA